MTINIALVGASNDDLESIANVIQAYFREVHDLNVVIENNELIHHPFDFIDVVSQIGVTYENSREVERLGVDIFITTAYVWNDLARMRVEFEDIFDREEQVMGAHKIIVLEECLRHDIRHWDLICYKPLDSDFDYGYSEFTNKQDLMIQSTYMSLRENDGVYDRPLQKLTEDNQKAADELGDIVEELLGLGI
jgi:hypothetical protein